MPNLDKASIFSNQETVSSHKTLSNEVLSKESILAETKTLIDMYIAKKKRSLSSPSSLYSNCSNHICDKPKLGCGCASECIAECVQATCNQCDAPVLTKLVNTIYTALPCFKFTESAGTVTLVALDNFTSPSTPYSLSVFDYYVRLPNETHHEVRMLWPVVWMIPELINKLGTSRFIFSTLEGDSGQFGYVSFKINLNVLSSKIVKDPAQQGIILSTDNISNEFDNAGVSCACKDVITTWNYNFLLQFLPANTMGGAGTLVGITIMVGTPSNSALYTIFITPPLNSPTGTPLTSNNFVISEPIPGNAVTFSATLFTLLALANANSISPIDVSSLSATQVIIESYGGDASEIVTGSSINTPTPSPTDMSILFTVDNTSGSSIIEIPVPPIGSIQISSFAHYISFVLTTAKFKIDRQWVATALQTIDA